MDWSGFSTIYPTPHRGGSKKKGQRKGSSSSASSASSDKETFYLKDMNPQPQEEKEEEGSTVEVGDKQLEFADGPMARPRRHLPPTPGLPLHPQPPPKPQRVSTSSAGEEPPSTVKPPARKPPPLPSDWAVIDLPSSDVELLQQTRQPEQLASLAAGYVTKHIHLHTDARVTAELADQIFKAMLEVAHHQRDILTKFLKDLIEENANKSSEVADHSQEPSHEAVIVLLKDILRQFLDPKSLVEVSLQLLRALSHVPGNAQMLVACQVTHAILGSMAALKTAESVQQHCLDVLAKIAQYHPSISEKAPLRESAIDLICITLNAHSKSLTIAQAGCRALANLANTLYTITSNCLDSGSAPSEELHQFVSQLIAVLDYLYTKCMTPIQNILKMHGTDLTIKTEGRRFLFIYSKLEQLRQRKQQWLTSPESCPRPPPRLPPHHVPNGNGVSDNGDEGANKGIMKRSRSFENLRNPERKVTFDKDAASESCTPSSSSPSPTHRLEDPTEGEGAIQVLSRTTLPALPKRCPINPSGDSSSAAPPIGNRPDAEGSDSPYNHPMEYENWDLLRTLLQSRASLEGHSYSAPDIHFLRRLVKTQVVALVCALAVDGKDRQAVDLIDMPLNEIMQNSEVPPGVRQFITRQYSRDDTLMDVDLGLFISIIDAVRYKSLSFEMAQKSVLSIVKALDDGQSMQVVDVTVEFLVATILNRPLAPAMTVPAFVDEVCLELERAIRVSQNASALQSLMSEIRQCARRSSPRRSSAL